MQICFNEIEPLNFLFKAASYQYTDPESRSSDVMIKMYFNVTYFANTSFLPFDLTQ